VEASPAEPKEKPVEVEAFGKATNATAMSNIEVTTRTAGLLLAW